MTDPAHVVTVHLSPFAPGCADLDLSDQARWPVLIGRSPAQIAAHVVRRLDVQPHAVHFHARSDGTLDVTDSGPTARLLAVVFDAPAPAVAAAHDALVTAAFAAPGSARGAAQSRRAA